jgi:uncharacterized BrkB/YihY/UPF0761 family membrane protein
MPPRSIGRACLIALLVGLALVVIGPMVVSALAAVSIDATLTPAAREAAYQQNLVQYRGYFLWSIPLAMGLIFSGVIGLLFNWVTRVTTNDQPRS